MIKAGALFYAIVVSLIIAIISSSLLLFSYTSQSQFDNAIIQEQLIRNTNSGIQLLLSDQQIVPLNSEKIMDLFGKQSDSVKLVRKAWGAHELLISTAFFHKKSRTITALAGFPCDSNRACLYLADQDKPLAVCGKTLLKGKAFIPKAGIKRAYIEGQNFTGSEMIQGSIQTSKKQLPEFDEILEADLRELLSKKNFSSDDSIVEVENDLTIDSLYNSFHSKTIIFLSQGNLSVTGGVFEGNIAIVAKGRLKIHSGVQAKNIILIADHITIAENLKGSFQAFASDSLIVGKSVVLSYPSVLGVIQSKSSKYAALVLNDKDSVCGSLFILQERIGNQKCNLVLTKESYVMGQIYSQGSADAQGTIHGSLFCQNICLKTASSVYENHLLGAVIDVTELSLNYLGVARAHGITHKGIIMNLR